MKRAVEQRLRLLGACLALALLPALAGDTAERSPRYDPDRLPFGARWGSFSISVRCLTDDESGVPQSARILSRSGRVVREVRDSRIIRVRFVELNRRGQPEVWITGHSGGNHFDYTDYFFTQDGGLRNLLIYKGGSGGIVDARDFDRDGRMELVAWNDCLAHFDGQPFAGIPWVMQVIGWNGRRYADLSQRFPAPALARRRAYQAAIPRQAGFASADSAPFTAAAGFYANSLTIGRGDEARRWIKRHAPAPLRRWLSRHEATLRKAVANRRAPVRTSQQRVLQGP